MSNLPTTTDQLKQYEQRMIRTHWDDAEEKWYFSIVDVVQVLTDSVDGRKYWNKLKQRLKAEGLATIQLQNPTGHIIQEVAVVRHGDHRTLILLQVLL